MTQNSLSSIYRPKKIIFFGDIQDYLCTLAREHDPTAWLLDRSNLDLFQEDRDMTVYTSLGDLPKNLAQVLDVLRQATTIFYCPPPVSWSDNKTLDVLDPDASIQGMTETLLLLLPPCMDIRGLDKILAVNEGPIVLADQRKSNNMQLWVAGCSISHGIGVESTDRYGSLLAEELGLSCSFLTRPGSAIDWAADQILRSDVRSGDLIVWGITGWNRLTYVHQHRLLNGINNRTYDQSPKIQNIVGIENLFSHQTFYNHYYSIKKVINYCDKINAKLILVGLFPNHGLLHFLRSQKNYIHCQYELEYTNSILKEKFIDLGTDSTHPGPKQHQEYKRIIFDFIQTQA